MATKMLTMSSIMMMNDEFQKSLVEVMIGKEKELGNKPR